MILPFLVAAAAAAPCVLTGPRNAPFAQAPPRGAPLVLVLEVWPDGAEAGWTDAVLDTLEQRGLTAGIVVTPDALRGAAGLALAEAVSRGHEPVLALPTSTGVSLDGPGEARAIAAEMKARVGDRPRSIWAPLSVRRDEAILLQAGFRTQLAAAGGTTAEARPGARYENQIAESVVLPVGTYHDPCGADARVVGFGPQAGDRVSNALRAAAAAGGFGIVRLAIVGDGGSAEDAGELAAWLDQVLLPSGIEVLPPDRARLPALRAAEEPAPIQTGDVGGRLVAVADVRAAALTLQGAQVVPRTLPGDLTPTEAWTAFVFLLVGRTEGEVVRIGELAGPEVAARSTLAGPTAISGAVVLATARAIAAAPPPRVPASLPMGDTLLTAGESLLALAAAVRGDDPIVVAPVQVPEPNQAGLGWDR